MHSNSRLLFDKYAKGYFQNDMRVLEIGPDKFPSIYQTIINNSSIVWDTVDMYESPHLTYVAKEEYSYPIQDNYYDIIISGQVLEHVRKVWVWIKELARICKDGGVVIIINPVSWPYHAEPVDCFRVYPEGMRALYEEAGLKVTMSICESLEHTGYRRYMPGMSLDSYPDPKGRIWRIINLTLGMLGWPVERSYDTITVGKK